MPVYKDGKNWSDRKLAKYPAAQAGDNSRYYRMTKADGTVVQDAVKLDLLNTVTQAGVPVTGGNLNAILAAKNVTTGTKNMLEMEQEGFLLEDGAAVQFRLHLNPSPKFFLKVGNAPFKRVISVSKENIEDLKAGAYVTATYSAALDAYIASGGGGGNAALSQSINLLEEVVDMKYCKVLTNEVEIADDNAAWLSAGALRAYCETTNYLYYARIRTGAQILEIRRVHKTTKVIETKAQTLAGIPCPIISKGNGASGSYGYSWGKMYIFPVKNSDCILFSYFVVYYQNGILSANFNSGIVFDDLFVNMFETPQFQNLSANYVQNRPFGLINGIYDAATGLVYCALMNTSTSSSYAQPSGHTLYAFNKTTHAQIFLNTPATFTAIYVVSPTVAVSFDYTDRDMSTSVQKNARSTITMSATAVGSWVTKVNYTHGIYPTTASCYSLGWYLNEAANTITLCCVSNYYLNNAPAVGGVINMLAYNYATDVVTTSSKLLMPSGSISAYVGFLPGISTLPVVLIGNGSTDKDSGSIYNWDTTQVRTIINTFSTYVQSALGTFHSGTNNTGSTITMLLDNTNAVLSGYIDKTTLFQLLIDGSLLKFSDIDAPEFYSNIKIWECPEDGVYKFIAVGGGAAGTSGYGGGAGYLKIGTASLVAGELVEIQVGVRGVNQVAAISDFLLNSGNATGSRVGDFLYALPGAGNMGGATGAATPNGGGAGGYDLVNYGGQGMNFTSNSSTQVTVTSTSQTISVGNIALSKDRNGGTSSNAGAVTSGDGYGAGGGMNQPGKDGCVVILR